MTPDDFDDVIEEQEPQSPGPPPVYDPEVPQDEVPDA